MLATNRLDLGRRQLVPAYSLCDLIELLKATGQWDREAVDVHVDALRFFRRYERMGRQSEMGEVLAGLRQVCDRVRAVAAAANEASDEKPS